MIDTHIHLDEEAYAADREEVIRRQLESGVEAMLVPGVNAESIEGVLDVCRRHKGYCYPALGFHPQDITPDWKTSWAKIEAAIRAHRDELVAIGEIGLDYHYEPTYREEQHEAFRVQLDLAQELDLPVMIHNRDATEDTLQILRDTQIKNEKFKIKNSLRGVVHCFNGSRETAEQILGMGFYLGIGGVLTFKNCKLAEMLKDLNERRLSAQLSPLTAHLLLETDGPYLAPTPYRGQRNESRLMIHVADRLAEVLGCSSEAVIEATNRNARQLFGLN
ncbi:MAG: TatD family hydrolase [Paludibacteraceae bacterium]|nr:TatD family hydrolase [Paludibacteraceae bacterium]